MPKPVPIELSPTVYTGPSDPYFVTALARGLDVLNCYRASSKLLGNGELASRTGLPKSTVARLTHTLTRLGYLTYDPGAGKYGLGPETLLLGSLMLSKLTVRELARPRMQELADFSQGMVSLGMRSRLQMIYIENRRSDSALTLRLDVGSRIPIAATAMGRAYIAAASERERNEILDLVKSHEGRAWPETREGIQTAIVEYQSTGCCSSFGDWQSGVNAIAVAFTPAGGGPQLALSCGGPAFTLTRELLIEKVRPKLLDIVRGWTIHKENIDD